MMPPGIEPLRLFRTMAHNAAILERRRTTGAYLLNHGTLPARDRELVIQRTTARCGSEYEWGVHATFYGERVGFSQQQIDATVSDDEAVWSDEDRLLIRAVDELHDRSSLTDETWSALEKRYSAEQLVELVYLVGQYHTISFITNAFAIDPEAGARRFPTRE